ncbi:hypothetical protein CesoFtcFv8_022248 [Champsocephalus esox]|uniref:26S proteasome regulatory subunit RPN5 C-terminal domain-containing protein n=1 Tax=Champsocephalus esox TaxID=159716 RepID=A0AAN8GJW7_9TELE|nr:hypothetical protein CesoFtcFv8_022248 [Champsocephalus esox]
MVKQSTKTNSSSVIIIITIIIIVIIIINFQRPKDPNDLLNDWSRKLNSLMSLVNKTTHLIAKEEMIHNLQ